jgi:hypothetical protein
VQEEYVALREHNQTQIEAYHAKVAEPFEKNKQSFDQYAKDQAAAKDAEASKDTGKDADGGKGGEGKG